ncbi:hypothetical protein FHT39_000315 [Mitsuaria sp. BK045]|uniref:DUF2971 domain-containing protein n=1 Tax=unclassified Roseateles TaxID=2626991 RepID=UPI00160D8AD2|nr:MULTISPECIES: DUF2971 domain-containing protein [unclassified Roseateles]MBB3291676.1 hypothetical protein [Mitsuaria sp. BK041]MBB3360893.1 hypothetical protein [Mitsuaria sp. BK045]
MYVFKYSAPSILSFGALSRGELYFASAEELNDGSECRPRYILKGAVELWTRLADMLLLDAVALSPMPSSEAAKTLGRFAKPLGRSLHAKVGKRDLDFEQLGTVIGGVLPRLLEEAQLGPAAEGIMALVLQACARARKHLDEPAYIASLTTTPRDPTMWGHYGGAERGFAIMFHAPEGKLRIHSPLDVFDVCREPEGGGPLVVGPYTEAAVDLQPVLYRAAPQRFNAFHRLIHHFSFTEAEEHYDVPLLLPGDAPTKKEAQYGLIKAKTWKYEQEVRALLPTGQELTPEQRCTNYDRSQMAGLVFGPKMSEGDKARAVMCCCKLHAASSGQKRRSTPFVFLQARQQVSSFEMEISVAGVLQETYGDRSFQFRPISEVDDVTKAMLQELLISLGAR